VRRYAVILLSLCAASTAQADINIGIAGPLSGPNAGFGGELRTGVSAAIAEINKQGGINGESLVLVEGDDNCDPKRATDIAREFKTKDVRLVVGHFCSSATLAAAPIYAEGGILLITPSASSPDITMKNLWNVFRLTGRDDAQAEIAAQRIKTAGESAAVLMFNDQQADTSALVLRFRNALPQTKVLAVKPGDIRMPDDATINGATAAYLPLQSTDAASAAKGLRKVKPALPLYGPDYLQSEIFGTRAAEAAENTRATFLRDWATVADPRRASVLPTNEGSTLAAYAAVETFVAAAKARSVNDARAMASWLTGGNEMDTIVGKIRFTASGDLQQQPYVWYQWRGGAFVPESTTN
jgi:branched-chain amino acid transport system substrate-binding protein